ncbi:MAG: hypothetical protein ACRD2U_04785 [Terriglobales bacterium]
MERSRVIAAAPVRSAFEAWRVVCSLLADTLERSPSVPVGSVTNALEPLKGLGAALIAGGHLESKGLVLVDTGLHLTVRVLTADAALDIEENLNPVPGGANATEGWTLYLPPAGPLDKAVAIAVKDSVHLSTDTPPTSTPAEKSKAGSSSVIDLDALRSLGKNL